ncbi:hypothetical protein NDU88_001792 [Pleurodeles waltl]|uniref:Uncharacterized protein n=1 Tax=Pleurodeles waltl TaxID=8319 RepID=A0AAV7VCR6_PLEWA|nr:hypothetical protein NDU88_001792 [Pleurodeles waltl]
MAGSEPEDTFLGNPDIRIPVTEIMTARPWRVEEDARNQEEDKDVGDPKRETDARGEEKTESETGEMGERQGEEPHAEQLTSEDRPKEGKRNPETLRHRHFPGGAWLLQVLYLANNLASFWSNTDSIDPPCRLWKATNNTDHLRMAPVIMKNDDVICWFIKQISKNLAFIYEYQKVQKCKLLMLNDIVKFKSGNLLFI